MIPVRIDEYVPFITTKDIQDGEIPRYFVRSTNNSSPAEIVEVAPATFHKLQGHNFYTLVSLRWIIRGPVDTVTGLTDTGQPIILQYGVADANKRSVEIADQIMPGITKVVTNYVRFYQGL
jgi:hypothetical protein